MSTETDIKILPDKSDDIFQVYFNAIDSTKDNLEKSDSKELLIELEYLKNALLCIRENLKQLSLVSAKEIEKNNTIDELILNTLESYYYLYSIIIRKKEFIVAQTIIFIKLSALLNKVNSFSIFEVMSFLNYFTFDYDHTLKSLKKKTIKHEITGIDWEDLNQYDIRNQLIKKKVSAQFVSIVNFNGLQYYLNTNSIEEKEDITYLLLNKFFISKSIIESGKYGVNLYDIKSLNFDLLLITSNSFEIINFLNDVQFCGDFSARYWEIILRLDKNWAINEIGFLFISLSTAFDSVEDTKLLILNQGNGSLWFKFKALFNGKISEEDIKEILEKSKRAVESQYLDKPIEEVNKIKVEKEKIEKEIENLPEKEELQELRSLELAEKYLELEEKELDIMKKKLEIINGLSDLIAKGLMQNDHNYQLLINELLFMGRKDKKHINGIDIDLIKNRRKIITDKE